MAEYTVINTVIQTTWDDGATTWDKIGNVINTYWDESDPAYSDASTTTPTYNATTPTTPSYSAE